MGLAERHAYRCGYLKSEKWEIVRLECLVRDKAKCQICGDESIFNDAHHVWYPKRSVYDTTVENIVTLCRSCHSFLHVMMPDCITNDKEVGLKHWSKFRDAIIAWRIEKIGKFTNTDGFDCVTRQQLILAVQRVRILFIQKYKPEGGLMRVPQGEFFQAIGSLKNITSALSHEPHKK